MWNISSASLYASQEDDFGMAAAKVIQGYNDQMQVALAA